MDTLISIIFIIFGCIPFHKTNNYIIILLTKITSFTGGIYYIHLEIWQLLDGFPFIKKYFLLRYISIYLLSYIICNIGYKLSNKSKLKYLFVYSIFSSVALLSLKYSLILIIMNSILPILQ